MYIKIIKTIKWITLSTTMALGGGHGALAAKWPSSQAEFADNNIQSASGQITKINLMNSIPLPQSAFSNTRTDSLDKPILKIAPFKSYKGEAPFMVNIPPDKAISNYRLINIALWAYLRVLGITLLIYGVGIAIDLLFTKFKQLE